jgi:MFS transporter, UMF1 family
MMSNKPRKGIIAWCLFDWANSAFPIIVSTFVFATYFTKSIAINPIIGTTQWGDMIALSGLLIALLGPIFGSIADYSGRRKPWLAFFSIICIVSTCLLWFAYPQHSHVLYLLVLAGIGTMSMEISNIFYNSMLNFIAPPNKIGRLSGWGWGCGYFGGLVCLSICLVLFVNNTWLNLDSHTAEQIRICGPFVGLWFVLFGWPLFTQTADQKRSELSFEHCIKLGVIKLYKTIRSIAKQKDISRFLLARLLYIDGLNTIFAFGGIYAAGTFNMSFSEVLIFGIAMNLAAGIGAIAMAWVDDLKGSKFTIVVSLVILIGSGLGMLLVTSKLLFWSLGMCLSLFVGPLQAASRTMLIRLSPPDRISELFGLYAFSGKATAFLGPFLLAQLTAHFHSQRAGMSIVIMLMSAGLIIIAKLNTGNSSNFT